jgi:hypothetical protein
VCTAGDHYSVIRASLQALCDLSFPIFSPYDYIVARWSTSMIASASVRLSERSVHLE